MLRLATLLLAATMLLTVASDALAVNHWRKTTVMNHTGANARPTWGFGANPDTWGWFGVRYWPQQSWHTGYYGDTREWGYRQGY